MTEIVRGQIIHLLDEHKHVYAVPGGGTRILPAGSFVQVVQTHDIDPGTPAGELLVRYECEHGHDWDRFELSLHDRGARWEAMDDVSQVDYHWDTRRVLNAGDQLPRVAMPASAAAGRS